MDHKITAVNFYSVILTESTFHQMSNIELFKPSGNIELKSISVNVSVDPADDKWWEQSISTQFPVANIPGDGKRITSVVGSPHAGYTIECDISQHILQGPACIRSTKGIVIAELEFRNGIAQGPCTFYYNSGLIFFKGNLENGLRQGMGKEYREDGSLLFEGMYEHGKKRNIIAMEDMKGYWMELDENQKVKSISKRNEKGNFEGICYVYVDGQISKIAHYKDGKEEITLKKFENNKMTEYRNGQRCYEGGFVNTLSSGYMRAGFGQEYDKSGNNLSYEGNFINGMRHGEGRTYKNGKPTYNGKWIQGKKKCTYYSQKVFVTLLGAAIVALAFIFFLQYYYVGIILALLYCLLLWSIWRTKYINYVLTITKSEDIIQLNSKVTGIIVPSNCCNDVYELDLSNCSRLEYIEIGDNSFKRVQTVRICGLPKLKRIKIGRMSFTEKTENYGKNREKSFFLIDCKELEHFEVAEWSFSDFGGEFQLAYLPNLETLTCGTLDKESFNFYGCALSLQGFDHL